MKSALKVIGALLLMLIAAGGVFGARIRSQMPKTGAARIEVTPRIVGVLSQYSYAWVVKTDHGALLIDAGVDVTGAPVLAELKALGLSAAEVHTVLMTHGHNDHFGGLGAFGSAKVYVGRGDAVYLRGEKTTMPRFMLPAVKVPPQVEELSPDAALELDGVSVKTVSIPGHTAGSTAYLIDGVLFTGDSLMQRDGELKMGPDFFSDDVAQNRRSIARLEALDFTAVADGHAGLTRDPKPKVVQFLARAK
ncbi:MAG: MBL fold metallo-hydrolase [Archangiaceae bacterium]|nr:MBL fold metallo-hydrolase [Archangiaceae bacterium]